MRNSNNLKRYINDTKVLSLISIFLIGIIFLGGTYSWWTWTSGTNTLVNFTANSNFSCSADGGGDITSGDVSLIPASCTNSDHVIKRAITTTVTNSGKDSVSLDLWLNVNTLGSYLTGNSDFKYTLSTSDSCTSNLVTSGDFGSVSEGGTIQLLSSVENVTSSTDTYYLYIWLDKTETEIPPVDESARQFNLTIGGQCENKPISYVLVTLDKTDGWNWNYVDDYDWVLIDDYAYATKNFLAGSSYGNLPIPDMDGEQDFLGWYTEPDGGTLVTSDTQLVSDQNHTLYAHWGTLSDEIVVTLNANGGYFYEDSVYPWTYVNEENVTKTLQQGSTYGTLIEPDYENEYYVTDLHYNAYGQFLGWYTEPDGGTLVTSSTTLSNAENHTLYAHWNPPVLVTLNSGSTYIINGQEYYWDVSNYVDSATKYLTVGQPYGDLPELMDDGYNWYTTDGELVTSDTIVTNTSDHVLYAELGNYTLTLNANGGYIFESGNDWTVAYDFSSATKIIIPGTMYGNLPTAELSGATFLGWYTQSTGGTKITSSSIVNVSGDQMLFAQYEYE